MIYEFIMNILRCYLQENNIQLLPQHIKTMYDLYCLLFNFEVKLHIFLVI
jgi:hypothetical protein